jgi:thiol-disulfide isomerase/thioredoxin
VEVVLAVAVRAAKFVAIGSFASLLCLSPVSSDADTTDPSVSISTLASVFGDSLPLAGHVVYLDFWASWCTPCRSSFPWMNSLLARYRDMGLQVVTIDLDSDPKLGREFLGAVKSTLPVFFDPKGSLAKQYRLEAMPTSFAYGRDGKLEFRHEGFHPKEAALLEAQISALLQEKHTQ